MLRASLRAAAAAHSRRPFSAIPYAAPSTIPPSSSPPPATSSSAAAATAPAHPPADLFEDDVLNALYAPPLSPAEAPPPVRRPASRADHAFLYSAADALAYARQLALEEQTVDKAVLRFRKAVHDAAKRGDVASHRHASALLAAWFGPMALAVRHVQTTGAVGKGAAVAEAVEGAGEGEGEGKGEGRDVGEKEGKAGLDGQGVSGASGASAAGRGRHAIEKEVVKLLAQLPAEAVSVIAIHVILAAVMKEADGVTLSRLAFLVGDTVRAEINMKKLSELRRQQERAENKVAAKGRKTKVKVKEGAGGTGKKQRTAKSVLNSAMMGAGTVVSAVNYAAQQVAVQGARWSDRETLLLGTALIDLLVNLAKVEVEGELVPAFAHFRKFRKGNMVMVGMVQLTDPALHVINGDLKDTAECVSPKQQPMVVRPRPWIAPHHSPYLSCQAPLIRTSQGKALSSALGSADLSALYEGLNALGDTAWRVNEGVLRTAEGLWDQGGGVAGLVSMADVEVPDKKAFMARERKAFESDPFTGRLRDGVEEGQSLDASDYVFDEKRAARRLRTERRKAQKINRELFSMRADARHKMDQAAKFLGEEKVWLPHNVDFRGRAYPIPAYLQHMGCDLTRSMMTFAGPGVELGPRGAYWLKVHLANKLGADKLSFAERVEFAEANIPKAIDVGREPLADRNLEWWSKAESPFQLLAACLEIERAVGRNGGERVLESFESCLPVAMDGSCNGLQHYAALGRDLIGGEQVNLVPNDRPQDVYSGIAALVSEKVDQLAAQGDEMGLLLQGKITRKVVKQTVMTSVYGVTMIGARQQIGNRLAEIPGFPEERIFAASMRVASLTLSSLGDIFSGATRTMEWLYSAATVVSQDGHEVQWTTPLGLPVIQPYRRSGRAIVQTLMQRIAIDRAGEHSPVSTVRQRSAFAPNFVHSIDSSHMLLTAIECRRGGLNFAAVHDSFWTNAAHVDEMNKVLRDKFVELHSRDLLTELRESFLIRYPGLDFPPVPPRGELDLEVVKDSPFFFS